MKVNLTKLSIMDLLYKAREYKFGAGYDELTIIADEIVRRIKEAHNDGYDIGYDKGFDEGERGGYKTGYNDRIEEE